ncbi:hypothetical protein NM688_g3219 [Phlebia brevispora]|uniref:Uncharacterized protein n=1 Tax=Phlebia brevispora TaxID=194682 RepID=A0ACC1T645_9APHY|nr:hypothetical protein NM688_g3219 [Phlebia brevispora]
MTTPPNSNPLAALIPENVQVGPHIGVGYVGVAVSSLLYGVVIVIWFLDSAQQAIVIETFYRFLIVNFANPSVLLNTYWYLFSCRLESCRTLLGAFQGNICMSMIFMQVYTPDTYSSQAAYMCDVFAAFIFQTFLVSRIWRFGRNLWITGFCAILTLNHLGSNLIFPIKALFVQSALKADATLKTPVVIGLCSSLAADVFIAGVMTMYLYTSRTGFRRSDHIISKLITLTITTGSLSFSVELGALIAYLVSPTTSYDMFLFFCLSKLSVISLLTTLNTRELISGSTEGSEVGQLNSIPLSGLGFQRADGSRSSAPINIVISETVTTDKAEVSKPPLNYEA